MEFKEYVRKPFIVEAVEVTEENIEEIAKDVGEIRYKEDGKPFIFVDRRLVPNITKVYPGFFMTRMDDHVRCYSRKVFFDQFTLLDEGTQQWVDFINAGGTSNSRVGKE